MLKSAASERGQEMLPQLLMSPSRAAGGLQRRAEWLCAFDPCGPTRLNRFDCTKRSSTFVVCTGIRLWIELRVLMQTKYP